LPPLPALSDLPEAPPRQEPEQSKAPKKSRKSSLWGIIGTIVLTLVIILLAVGGWYAWALTPKSGDEGRKPVTIANGDTVGDIAANLERNGLIHSALAFQVYVNASGVAAQLQAGHYRVAPSQSVAEIVELLTHPQQGGYNVIILPGMTLKQLADPKVKNSLAAQGFSQEEIAQALKANYSSPLLKDKPSNVDLEGYIFPETYQMGTNDTLEQLFERTFDELYNRMKNDGTLEKLAARGFTIHQALTLASIVQKEVSDVTVQPQVAQVFEHRLSIGMQLGSDVTFMYAAALDGAEPSVNYESPYNTRKYAGLPPGPIANMNYSALQAVATPAPGDYLYFVAGDDGETYFSRTEAEHLELVRLHCTTLCQ
jgi:UPF0755 protein